ncbi:histidine--tRNA ligase [Marinilongibacter aquaticus]|uniref:histidine--tRNA ligase n=1 Tax=Marinilongibacter aquaticus TaxID=2975157 RepID=UPI0021BD7AFB|nr:histidine--tRNA ligase [Marinilongibacter aquaticus]UBM58928.1 histidine--tRNA ligase [Marinilongibacter aquaticus]
MSKPSLARGTRDFGPEIMAKRTYILENIKSVFKNFGFLPLETPAIENLSVLMGKYGEEGDQLLFKILNSGDFMKKVKDEDVAHGASALLPKIAEKGLRYDLTVPFARYVVMNRHELAMPFKRFQIQPVWRADRPQRGRYREFYQCDADVVGTDSLLCEAEIVMMLHEALEKLNLGESFLIKINNRKVLTGIAETIGAPGRESELCVAIDKLDKIGRDKVEEELVQRGFNQANIDGLNNLFTLSEDLENCLSQLKSWLSVSEIGMKGIAELEEVFGLVRDLGLEKPRVQLDATLARGLSYYTGAIFEVKALGVSIGSICGGGRYDNLTGTFGLPDVSGVGISFGIDRIYDVMEELDLFPENTIQSTEVLLINFDSESQKAGLPILTALRQAGIAAEMYPSAVKLKKQFDYANKKNIPYVLVIGSEEIKMKKYSLKNMLTGEQEHYTLDEIKNLIHV